MLKRAVVRLMGRERANRVSEPFHAWRARRRTLRNLAALPREGLCVNLGCGPAPLEGWVNLDIARGPRVDVVWDLRRGLPFGDGSCEAVFGEHVIEHLSREDAGRLAAECLRVLRAGGVLRLSTPDAGRFLRSYAGDGEFLRHPAFPTEVESPIDRVNVMMREGGQHLWAYDGDSLLSLLRRAGFAEAVEQQFGVSAHPRMRNIDMEARAFESLYVEAFK
ncbi:MAG TPA: methyltransferase domain-containing protein [Pyrinomonadaceae bacterium]|nr:methyltransferase domain-containing protein [Pyrinomonadaceae bacterium]